MYVLTHVHFRTHMSTLVVFNFTVGVSILIIHHLGSIGPRDKEFVEKTLLHKSQDNSKFLPVPVTEYRH